jgi:hypothetical protein
MCLSHDLPWLNWQAYGMMGWRVGYLAYPDFEGDDALGRELLKVQDTVREAGGAGRRACLGPFALWQGSNDP